jgi:hypothetical protein
MRLNVGEFIVWRDAAQRSLRALSLTAPELGSGRRSASGRQRLKRHRQKDRNAQAGWLS